jgi:hypothetical protein
MCQPQQLSAEVVVLESRPMDRRAAVRRPSRRGSVARCGWSTSQAWGAALKDVSATGLSLLLHRRFRRGDVLEIEPLGKDRPANQQVRVVRSAAQDGGWLLGCEFLSPISDAERSKWLS